MAYPYNYGGYPAPGGYYPPPMQDNLAQLRANPYQNNLQPTQMPVANQPVQAQQSTMTGPVFVNGEAGAKGYLVAAGNTVMLIDADPDSNVFWLKSADAAGMPSIRTFDYTERINAPRTPQEAAGAKFDPKVEYVTRKDFDALAALYDAIAEELDALKAKKTSGQKKSMKEDTENE